MASKRIGGDGDGDLVCTLCDKRFKFASKYSRHLESSDHIRFQQSLDVCLQDDVDAEDIDNEGGSSCEFGDAAMSEITTPQTRLFKAVDDDVSSQSSFEDLSGLESDSVEEENDAIDFGVHSKDYNPFKSCCEALAFMLIKGPRPMGEGNLRFVCHIFGMITPTSGFPSYSTMSKLQLPGYVEPTQHFSSSGLPFYSIKPSTVLKRCLSIPEIASEIARVPIFTNGEMRELYHGETWLNDSRFFTPMTTTAVGDVFVNDFVHCSTETFAKIIRFYKDDSLHILVEVMILNQIEQGAYSIGEISAVSLSSITEVLDPPSVVLQWNGTTYCPMPEEEYERFIAPHRLKSHACGRPVVMAPVVLFSDDTSGNRSKQWNKFDSWSLQIACLPNKSVNKLHNIHFLCCSNRCDALDMVKPLVEDLNDLEMNGVVTYDALLEKDVLLVAPLLAILSDNPRHSELLNHLGPSSKMYCRMCMASRGDKSTTISTLRNKEQTLDIIEEIQLKVTEKEKAECRTKYGIREKENPLLDLHIDLHKSTPVEVLHSILLGPYKYLLRSLMTRLTSQQKKEVQSVVAAFNFSGFKHKVGSKLSRHYRSFVGRDFKALAQCALFAFDKYFSHAERDVWIALSKVFKIAYCDFLKRENYSSSKRICEEFVHKLYCVYPDFQRKVKIHLMLHLVDNMISFGATSCFNTERFEAFNSLIRTANVYSNRLAPSRDIARRFETIGHLRSVCSGGNIDSDHSRAGRDLINLYKSPQVQAYLNGVPAREMFSDKEIYQHGCLRKLSQRNVTLEQISLTLTGCGTMTVSDVKQDSRLVLVCSDLQLLDIVDVYEGVIGDIAAEIVSVGDYVKYRDEGGSQDDVAVLVGCFKTDDNKSYCLLHLIQYVDPPITNDYDCPLLTLSNIIYCIASVRVKHSISVAHQCSNSCNFVNSTISNTIERESIPLNQLSFSHDWSNNLYCLNIYCINTCC